MILGMWTKFTIPVLASILILGSFGLIQDADAIKAQGKSVNQYGSKTASIICGDRLCSEYPGGYEQFRKEQGQSSKIGDEAITPKIAEEKEVTLEEEVLMEETMEEEMMMEETMEEEIDSFSFQEQVTEQPNIIVIMADAIGWYTIGAYDDKMMAAMTPNIKRIAEEGTRFTDYYTDPSSTAGRASLITGELPIRIGLTTVGQVGADIGMPDECPTIATVLKSMGYATGQFGKNHFGNLNKHLPTVHGFDEFFGYLFHLDALDPFQTTFPLEHNLILGPRNMIHTWASDVDDKTVDPRWGKVGKQIIEGAGPVTQERMKTLDNEILDHSINFMQKSLDEDKPCCVVQESGYVLVGMWSEMDPIHQCETNNQKIHQIHELLEDVCSGYQNGFCQTAQWSIPLISKQLQ